MSALQFDAFGSDGQAILADQAFIRNRAHHSFQFLELLLRKPLRYFPDLLSELQQLLIAHLIDIDIIVFELRLESIA